MTSAEAAPNAAGGLTGIVQQLRANPLVPLIVGVSLAVALLAGMLFWANGPSYGVLYSGLSDADGGEIIAQLEQMQLPYQVTANGSAIMIPTTMVDQTRLTLASQGLPQSGGVGFEIMDNQAFGISQFAEHVNYMRALQGELARSIETVAAVASARVHLAIPEPSVFVREQELPSASVILNLHDGRALSESQVSAIVHLVSASVTNLPIDNVTVVDARGRLLSNTGDGAPGVDGSQIEYVAEIERAYRESIEAILAPVVGRANVRAQVVADVDFSVGERTEEIYAPNRNPANAAVRSEQISVSLENGQAAIGGVPGALSNRPAADVPSPINNPAPEAKADQNNAQDADPDANQNDTGLNMAGRAGFADVAALVGDSGATSRSSTVNYEVNRTIRHIQKETGRVERLSAAVVVDYQMQPVEGTDGEMQPAPLSDERMQQIRNLVQQAIGYSAARGDSLSVVNVPFNEPPAPVTVDAGPPWWQNPQIIALVTTCLQYLLIAIVAFLIWRKLVRPLLDQVPHLAQPRLAAAGGPALPDASGYEDEEDDAQDSQQRQRRRKRHAELRETTQDLARSDPKLVAMIVKSWMSSNG